MGKYKSNYSPSTYGSILGQTWFVNLAMPTNLREQSQIQITFRPGAGWAMLSYSSCPRHVTDIAPHDQSRLRDMSFLIVKKVGIKQSPHTYESILVV